MEEVCNVEPLVTALLSKHKWKNDNVIKISNDDKSSTIQPLNCSLKETITDNNETSTNQYMEDSTLKTQKTNQIEMNPSLTLGRNLKNLSTQSSDSIFTNMNEYLYEDRNLSNSNPFNNCSSNHSTSPMTFIPGLPNGFFNSNTHSCHMDRKGNNDQVLTLQHLNQDLSMIKPEELFLPEQAINLSKHNDSGVESTDTINDRSFGQGSSNDSSSTSPSWREVTSSLLATLNVIQHEMHQINYMKKRRMLLEVAMFKFLHPNFQFNW